MKVSARTGIAISSCYPLHTVVTIVVATWLAGRIATSLRVTSTTRFPPGPTPKSCPPSRRNCGNFDCILRAVTSATRVLTAAMASAEKTIFDVPCPTCNGHIRAFIPRHVLSWISLAARQEIIVTTLRQHKCPPEVMGGRDLGYTHVYAIHVNSGTSFHRLRCGTLLPARTIPRWHTCIHSTSSYVPTEASKLWRRSLVPPTIMGRDPGSAEAPPKRPRSSSD